MFKKSHPKLIDITWKNEQEQKRLKTIMLILSYINKDAKNHIQCEGKSEDFILGFQEALESIRCILLDELAP